MKMSLIAMLLSLIFLVLSLIHFNWAFGSDRWMDSAIPTDSENQKLFQPRFLECFVIAVGLLILATLPMVRAKMMSDFLPEFISKNGLKLVTLIFFARCIGEFKYVGIFKKVKGTAFAKADDQIFNPLCCLIGILAFLVDTMIKR
jgi:hypothetical protein